MNPPASGGGIFKDIYMSEILYRLIILPIKYAMEVVFYLATRLFHFSIPASILCLSFCVFLFTLPLYSKAQFLKEQEDDKQKNMKKWVDHIRENFRGDERQMMLMRYYRISSYHPVMALKGTIPLFLQIPFFMAAYSFLANLPVLEDVSFLWIESFARPDALIQLGGLTVNLLPILMTAINLCSALVYNKGKGAKSLIQPVILASIFLVLLYRSPSGLVLYWTFNNSFSLIKSLTTVIIKKDNTDTHNNTVKNRSALLLNTGLFLFNGLFIPLMLISASVRDFYKPGLLESPWRYLFMTAITYAGVFMLWGNVIYAFLESKGKKLFHFIMTSILVISIGDFLLFNRNQGFVSNKLIYDNGVYYSEYDWTIAIILCFSVFLIIFYMMKEKKGILPKIINIIVIAMLVMIMIRLFDVSGKIQKIKAEPQVAHQEDDQAVIKMSSEGKNVMVIMIDRAINSFIPYILEEKPELKAAFDGFTYYPNTLSTGGCTCLGAAPIYGGYEYTQSAMCERRDVSYLKKGDEALSLMPLLFYNKGYGITVADDPLGNDDHETPFAQLYDPLPGTEVMETVGKYSKTDEFIDVDVYRNFVFYSIFRSAPAFLARSIYQDGEYMSITKPSMLDEEFWNSYSTLRKLPELTETDNNANGNFIMFKSMATHAPCILQLPDYVPAVQVDNSGYKESGCISSEQIREHYHVNMSTMIQLGRLMDRLRELGVYDNTRIIIVSDHGKDMGMITLNDGYIDVTYVNPLLMVKDFNSEGFTVSDEFMTNADVPAIAMEGIVEDPANPYTGNPVDCRAKEEPVGVSFEFPYRFLDENGVDYAWDISERPYYEVHDNIFEADNWKQLW